MRGELLANEDTLIKRVSNIVNLVKPILETLKRNTSRRNITMNEKQKEILTKVSSELTKLKKDIEDITHLDTKQKNLKDIFSTENKDDKQTTLFD